MDHGAFSNENAFLFGSAVLSMCGKDFFIYVRKGLMRIIKRLIFVVIAAFLTMSLLFAGCSGNAARSDAASAESSDEILTIVWQGEGTIISISEIMDLNAVEREAVTIDSDNKESIRQVKGVLLEELLEKYLAISLSDIYSIRFTAGDGYAIEVPPEIVREREVILTYEMDGEQLEEKKKPLRAVIPDERSIYWVHNLIEIELIEGHDIKEITGIVFIDSLVKVLETQDYDYYGSSDRAVLTADLLMEFREEQEQDFIIMLSSDGLEKNEEKEIFKNGYLKITGDGVPAFLDPELPNGMWVKNIFALFYGQTAYVSAFQSMSMFENVEAEGKSGVHLENIVKEAGLAESENYILRALDGYTVEISSEDMGRGLIYIDEGQQLNVYFEDLEGSYSIKDLLSIENKK